MLLQPIILSDPQQMQKMMRQMDAMKGNGRFSGM